MTVLDHTDLSPSAYASAPRVKPDGYDEQLLASGGWMAPGGSYAITRANVEPMSAAPAARGGRFILPAKPPGAATATQAAPWLPDMVRAVAALPQVIENWKGWAEPPNAVARQNAMAVLRTLSDVAPALRPTKAVPMADEGIVIWLAAPDAGGLPASIECYNTGAIVFALSEGDADHAWEVDRGFLVNEVRGLAARLNVAAVA